MSNSILSSFDPFAIHPFTAASTSEPAGQLHNPTRMPSSSPPVIPGQSQKSQGGTAYGNAPSNSHMASEPMQSALQSSQPRHAMKWPPQTAAAQPVFTPFKQEPSEPELRDILAKKRATGMWPAKATYAKKDADSRGKWDAEVIAS